MEYRRQLNHSISGRNENADFLACPVTAHAAFEYPRDFLSNRFVYLVISSRAGGLSIGVNLNPAVTCNLHCLYCEIDRSLPARAATFDLEQMVLELKQTLELAAVGWLKKWPKYASLPDDLLTVRHVALSGDGEPTLSRDFLPAVQAITHFRAIGVPFKLVLVTNSTSLDRPQVQEGLKLLTRHDEVWAKLDGGTQEYIDRINGPGTSLEKVLANILQVARRRPVVIQSLFPAIDGAAPAKREVEEYAQRLKELKEEGANIPLVQIYSATRPMARSGCSHLPLRTLSEIAKTVRAVAGLRAEVF